MNDITKLAIVAGVYLLAADAIVSRYEAKDCVVVAAAKGVRNAAMSIGNKLSDLCFVKTKTDQETESPEASPC